MKNLIICVIFLSLIFSCRTQKSIHVDDELSLGLDTTKTIVSNTPCRNKIYCNETLSRIYEDYPKYNIFLVKPKDVDQEFILPVKQDKQYKIDTTQVVILDTLQFNCSCIR